MNQKLSQTYRNGLRRYFLERPCPPAVDNFDLKKSSAIEFEGVSTMLSMKKKDLKQKGHGNKPNATQPVEAEDIEKMWSSGAIRLSLVHLVWWNNVMHLRIRGFKEQRGCQLSDFTMTEQYMEYRERQTKNRQGNKQTATAIILWKNSGECRISWPVSTQAQQLPTTIQVMLYGRLFSTAQPCQATQQLLVTVIAVPAVLVT